MENEKNFSEVLQDIVSFINTGSKFIIAGHKEPDGDCIGSQLALQSAVKRLGKEAIVCSAGPFSRAELRDYAGFFTAVPPDEEKAGYKLIIVDCSGIYRTGDLKERLDGLPCAVIDHHAASIHGPSKKEAPVYVDSSLPSCTLLIKKLIESLGLSLTCEEASLLFFGLSTDTGFFRHLTDANSSVFEAAAQMVKAGANPKKIYHLTNGGKSFESRILLGNILSRAESYFDGRLLLSYETHEDFKKFNLENRDSDDLNKMLQSIKGVQATVIIRQESDENCTVSLRSVDDIDVSKIAAAFGGGGHKNASGLITKGKITNVKKDILEHFSKIFISD
ncbi:MAG: bifunctional oligoribonuclease/PAP phosphatase NrnA [Treponema sp.]|jgi:phosphoesterase RecJ-like protein|nr:bifunctional oligoribonuclease/PAP phosphatase NrnA [Treponema sp.]